jgi:ribose 5-phosphate isomerase B
MKILSNRKIEYIDFGCFNTKDCDYNVYVKMAADYVLKNKEYFGIGICRSGQGINICANKIDGIRSCLITDQYNAEYAIRHNAGNFFALSSHHLIDDKTILWNVLNILYQETFDGGRHQTRMMANND